MVSPPEELVEAVTEALHATVSHHPQTQCPVVLAAIPDGWAKVDGAWVRLERHEDVRWWLYNADQDAVRMSLGWQDHCRTKDDAAARMASYHSHGDGYEVVERRSVWWSTPSVRSTPTEANRTRGET